MSGTVCSGRFSIRAIALHTLAGMVVAGLTLCPVAADDEATIIGPEPDGGAGGEFVVSHVPSLTEAQQQAIQFEIDRNVEELRTSGELRAPEDVAVSFEWPLRSAAGLTDFGYHGTSGFVDHNPAYPYDLLDYNCGRRTYDTWSGYNHRGVDFFSWPFPWNKMDRDQVEVVAAAPGTIVYKQDGNYDRNCGFNSNPWNAIYIMHADGSVAWYGHFKSGSLTAVPVGKSVEAGERLGVVGSSGSSTGPHLHFEIYSATGALIDPFAGPCNSTNSESWWAVQPPYRDSAINAITTGSSTADFGVCPAPEDPHDATVFEPGDDLYFTTFYRDQVADRPSRYSIYMPNGQLFNQWIHSSSLSYNASYWYWYWFNFAQYGPLGTWRFEVEFEGETYSHEILVMNILSTEIDIVPGDPANLIKPRSRSAVPVAVIGDDDVVAEQINAMTLRFGPREAAPVHDLTDPVVFGEHLRDVNHDGQMDLVSHYGILDTGLRCDDDHARQTGFLLDGRPFRGTGSIRPWGCGLVPRYPVERIPRGPQDGPSQMSRRQ